MSTAAQQAAYQRWQHQVRGALTDHQWKVAELVPLGLGDREIGKALYLTENTIKSHLKNVFRQLRPFTPQEVNRVILTVVCLRAGRVGNRPHTPEWATAATEVLTPAEQSTITMLAQRQTEEEAGEIKPQTPNLQLCDIREKLEPFTLAAGIERLDNEGIVEMFVRAGTIQTPAMRQRWRVAVARLVTPRECEVLTLVTNGMTNDQIAAELGLSMLNVKAHLTRVVARLKPYAPAAGVIRPTHRTGLTTIAIRAGLHETKSG